MKRIFIETCMAAMIFFAANAVYGVDALMGNNLSSARDFATALSRAPDNLQVRLGELAAMKLPQPYSLVVDRPGRFEHSLCFESSRGTYPARVRVEKQAQARELRSRTTSLPYSVDVQNVSGSGDKVLNIGRCEDSGSILVTIAIDGQPGTLFSEEIFTDTVTLVVDPE
jgi:hypothetical protein